MLLRRNRRLLFALIAVYCFGPLVVPPKSAAAFNLIINPDDVRGTFNRNLLGHNAQVAKSGLEQPEAEDLISPLCPTFLRLTDVELWDGNIPASPWSLRGSSSFEKDDQGRIVSQKDNNSLGQRLSLASFEPGADYELKSTFNSDNSAVAASIHILLRGIKNGDVQNHLLAVVYPSGNGLFETKKNVFKFDYSSLASEETASDVIIIIFHQKNGVFKIEEVSLKKSGNTTELIQDPRFVNTYFPPAPYLYYTTKERVDEIVNLAISTGAKLLVSINLRAIPFEQESQTQNDQNLENQLDLISYIINDKGYLLEYVELDGEVELWNNRWYGWTDISDSAVENFYRQYGSRVKKYVERIRQRFPQLKFVAALAGFSPGAVEISYRGLNSVPGVLNYVDYFSFHPYMATDNWNKENGLCYITASDAVYKVLSGEEAVCGNILRYREKIASLPKPVIFTEYGTSDDDNLLVAGNMIDMFWNIEFVLRSSLMSNVFGAHRWVLGTLINMAVLDPQTKLKRPSFASFFLLQNLIEGDKIVDSSLTPGSDLSSWAMTNDDKSKVQIILINKTNSAQTINSIDFSNGDKNSYQFQSLTYSPANASLGLSGRELVVNGSLDMTSTSGASLDINASLTIPQASLVLIKGQKLPTAVTASCYGASTNISQVDSGQTIVYSKGTTSPSDWGMKYRYGGLMVDNNDQCGHAPDVTCSVVADYFLGSSIEFGTNVVLSTAICRYDGVWVPTPPNSNPASTCTNTCRVTVLINRPTSKEVISQYLQFGKVDFNADGLVNGLDFAQSLL